MIIFFCFFCSIQLLQNSIWINFTMCQSSPYQGCLMQYWMNKTWVQTYLCITYSDWNNVQQLAIFQTFSFFVWTKLRLTGQIVWLVMRIIQQNKNSNLTVSSRLIISQEQSWPSGLLLYLIRHIWVQCWFVRLFSEQNSQLAGLLLSRCFCWTLSTFQALNLGPCTVVSITAWSNNFNIYSKQFIYSIIPVVRGCFLQQLKKGNLLFY